MLNQSNHNPDEIFSYHEKNGGGSDDDDDEEKGRGTRKPSRRRTTTQKQQQPESQPPEPLPRCPRRPPKHPGVTTIRTVPVFCTCFAERTVYRFPKQLLVTALVPLPALALVLPEPHKNLTVRFMIPKTRVSRREYEKMKQGCLQVV